MAGRFFVLVICAICIASIESDEGSIERQNENLVQFRKILLKMRHNPFFRDKYLLSLTDMSNISSVTSMDQKDLPTKKDSLNKESKNETNYHLETSGEYIPTGNPEDFSQSTAENSSIKVISSSPDVEISSTELKANQTTSDKDLIISNSSTDVIAESSSLSTNQDDSSKASSSSDINSTDAIGWSKEEDPSSTFSSTRNPISTASSSKEVSNDITTLISTESTQTAKMTVLSTTSKVQTSSDVNTENSDSTKETTKIGILTSSTEISEDKGNFSISSESTHIADKTELTTLSKESTISTFSEIDTTNTDSTVEKFSSSTRPESSSVEPKEITVTDEKPQQSTKATDTINEVTSTVFPSSSINEEETGSTVTESNHIVPIYNPTVTTVKLALSITFMVLAFLGFTVLLGYMVKRKRENIPYEELSLEP